MGNWLIRVLFHKDICNLGANSLNRNKCIRHLNLGQCTPHKARVLHMVPVGAFGEMTTTHRQTQS